jgi:hypothetical protein
MTVRVDFGCDMTLKIEIGIEFLVGVVLVSDVVEVGIGV